MHAQARKSAKGWWISPVFRGQRITAQDEDILRSSDSSRNSRRPTLFAASEILVSRDVQSKLSRSTFSLLFLSFAFGVLKS